MEPRREDGVTVLSCLKKQVRSVCAKNILSVTLPLRRGPYGLEGNKDSEVCYKVSKQYY